MTETVEKAANKFLDETVHGVKVGGKKLLQKYKAKRAFKHELNKKCIILIGETGSGKTSLTELLGNYAQREDFKYKRFKPIIDTLNEKSQHSPVVAVEAESQTQFPQLVEIQSLNGEEMFYVLDTPGLCDTDGYQNDESHLTALYQLLKNLEPTIQITGVFFVYNSAESRSVINLKYVFESYKIFLPVDYRPILVCTRSNDATKIPRDRYEASKYVALDNPYVLYHELEKRHELAEGAYKKVTGELKERKQATGLEDTRESFERSNSAMQAVLEVGQHNFLTFFNSVVQEKKELPRIQLVENYELYIDLKEKIDGLMEMLGRTFATCHSLVLVLADLREATKQGGKPTPTSLIAYIKTQIARGTLSRNLLWEVSLASGNLIVCIKCAKVLSNAFIQRFRVSTHQELQRPVPVRCEDPPGYYVHIHPGLQTKITYETVMRYLEGINSDEITEQTLFNRYKEELKTIDTYLKDNNFGIIDTLIESIQSKTMIKNYFDFLEGRKLHLENLLAQAQGDAERAIIRLYIMRYENSLKFLRTQDRENLTMLGEFVGAWSVNEADGSLAYYPNLQAIIAAVKPEDAKTLKMKVDEQMLSALDN